MRPGIGCWGTGAEQLRYKLCVGERILASSQLCEPSASSGSVQYWSWSKPQVDVKSFPEEPINPLAANSEGTSGNIYLWKVNTGRLLKKWLAHDRAVSCLGFLDDGSLLISGLEDGGIRKRLYLYPLNLTDYLMIIKVN